MHLVYTFICNSTSVRHVRYMYTHTLSRYMMDTYSPAKYTYVHLNVYAGITCANIRI